MSLPTYFSRKLPNNGGTIKASPIFTTTASKKPGSAVENSEPSSPKVTCIGQVRIKSKKKKRQNTTINGDVKQGNGNTCLPLTICDALRCDLSCFFPCRRERVEEKGNGSNGSNGSNPKSSCARWLVTLQDGEGGQGREIERVVGGDEEIGMMRRTSSRRRKHVLEDFEIKDVNFEEGRVSICLPPKNALLLMRCRSDPMKAAALSNRFCLEASAVDEDEEILQECEEARGELIGIVEEHLESDGDQETLLMKVEKVEKLEMVVGKVAEENSSSEALVINSLENNQIQLENRVSSSSSMKFDKEAKAPAPPLAMETSSIEEETEETEDLESTHQEEEIQDRVFEPVKLNDVIKREDQCMIVSSSTASSSDLPDCLLLMLFEPKLSMEV